MSGLYRYQAYGLCLAFNRPVRNLTDAPASAITDVDIKLADTQALPLALTQRAQWHASLERDAAGEPYLTIFALDSAEGQRFVQLRFGGTSRFAEFTMDLEGSEVWVSWREGARLEDIVMLFLRPVMAMILWLRGIISLHASVVTVDGRAVGFVGGRGAGKSSTAAALAQRGYGVLADDVAALDDLGDRFLVRPAYPALSFWPHTASTFLGATDLPHLWAGEEKRYLELTLEPVSTSFRFEKYPRPLAALYFFGPRHSTLDAPSIERIAPARGLMMLLANRYSRHYHRQNRRVYEFNLFSRVAKHIPLRLVQCPDGLATLSMVCDAILNDLSLLPAAASKLPSRTAAASIA